MQTLTFSSVWLRIALDVGSVFGGTLQILRFDRFGTGSRSLHSKRVKRRPWRFSTFGLVLRILPLDALPIDVVDHPLSQLLPDSCLLASMAAEQTKI